ncbi:unnamed protein product, partial [Mesorhabditis belari]|uniref:NADP-dependent oxidoreductase domain-containing protein n=1 Tax=Mesorhabditis belari TaxID=2138241 RepID=A0AAF3EBP5_9BILA
MQSHTFTRARGLQIYCNGTSTNSQPSTSRGYTKSSSEPSRKGSPTKSHRLTHRTKTEKESSFSSGLPPTFVMGFHEEGAVRRMPYRTLGNTGLQVSVTAFGCGTIGGLFGDIEDSISEMVESALRRGINWIDTAYWYGQARSESILGKILANIPRRAYYISTRIGRFELDFARNFDFRADKVLESLQESLKRLRLSYVDVCFLQLNDVDFEPNISIMLNETLQALEMARSSGKVRHIGIAGYPLKKIKSIIENSSAKIEVILTYGHATLNDNSLGEFIPFMHSLNIGVLNGSPLSMGLLSGEGAPPWHPASQPVRETVLQAEEYVHGKGVRLERLALDYSMHFPGISTCVVGCGSLLQLDEAIRIAETCDGKRSTSLSEFELRVRDRIMRRYFDKLNNAGWEDIDVARYWKRLKTLGLPSLATYRRHASVESLASTLNGLSMDSGSELRRTPIGSSRPSSRMNMSLLSRHGFDFPRGRLRADHSIHGRNTFPGMSMSRASSVVPISSRMESIEENRRLRRPFLAKDSRDQSWKP